MADLNILERLFGAKPVLSNEESFPLDRRRTPFNPMWGPNTGKPEAAPMRYIRGELEMMARKRGIRSDDPFEMAAQIETWRRFGYGTKKDKDAERVKQWLER